MRSRAIVAILLVAVVYAAGCGGADHHKTVNPEAMLDAAAAHPITSAQAEIDLGLQPGSVSQLPDRCECVYRARMSAVAADRSRSSTGG